MPLVTCPDCKTQCSDKAGNCIQCGFPITDYVLNKKIELIRTGDNSLNPEMSVTSDVDVIFDRKIEQDIIDNKILNIWKGKRNTIISIVLALMLVIIGSMIMKNGGGNNHKGIENIGVLLGLCGFAVGFYGMFLFSRHIAPTFVDFTGETSGESTQCPSCKTKFAAATLEDVPLGDYMGLGIEKRSDQLKNNKNQNVGTIERLETVVKKRFVFCRFLKCKVCGHKWRTTVTKSN